MPIEGNTGGGEGDSESGSRRSAPRATDGRKTSTGEKAKNGGAVTFETSLIAWLILFVLGGGLLTLYYAGIGYFPEVSWQDALTHLALMTIIGGCLLVAFSFLLVVPGAIWSEYLIFDPQIETVLTMKGRAGEPCVWSVIKRILFPFILFMAFCHFLLYEERGWIFVAVGAGASLVAVLDLLSRDLRGELRLLAMGEEGRRRCEAHVVRDERAIKRHRMYVAASHAPLLVAFILTATQNDHHGPTTVWLAALAPLLAFAGRLVHDRRKSRRGRRTSERATPPASSSASGDAAAAAARTPVRDEWTLLCRTSLAFGSAALLSLGALGFFHRIYSGGDALFRVPVSLLLLCTVVVIVTNLGVSVLFHRHPRVAVLASLLAALLLLGAGQVLLDAEMRFPTRIMEKFGFGGPAGTLVLTMRGGRILCEYGVAVEFEQRPGQTAGRAGPGDVAAVAPAAGGCCEKGLASRPRDEGLARTAGVRVLSRLGSEYVLGLEQPKQIIALPKEEIVSWSKQALTVVDGCTHPGH